MLIRRPIFFLTDTPSGSGTPGESPSGGAPAPGEQGTGAKPPAGGQGGSEDGEPDFASLDPKTQAYIKKLRTENANHRKEFNTLKGQFDSFQEKLKAFAGGDDPDQKLTPEQQVEQLTGQFESVSLQNAILIQAVQHGIPAAGLEYFQFKIGKALDELEEGAELTDEALAEIIKDVKAKSGASASGSTSPAPGGTTPPPKDNNDDGVTVEKFAASFALQNQIYAKDPQRYAKLRDEAKAKGLFTKR